MDRLFYDKPTQSTSTNDQHDQSIDRSTKPSMMCHKELNQLANTYTHIHTKELSSYAPS